jgi:Cytochrome P460
VKIQTSILTLAAVAAVSLAAMRPGTDAGVAIRAADPDTTGAAIWAHLTEEKYAENWDLWPGTERMYTGNQPHGMKLTTYVNDLALRAIRSGADRMPSGAIVVKENYMPNGQLAAVTVMYKQHGYNGDHNDWFFSKHLPSGELDKMEMNGMSMKLEGRLPGCQNCHGAKKDNDYLFTSELGG